MKVWLLGGGGAVRIVIIIKWSAVAQNKVKGAISVYRLDANGAAIEVQSANSGSTICQSST